MTEQKTIATFGEAEFCEQKSRFIGYAKPVTSEEEAMAFINEIRAKHRDATHNVYAFQIGAQNETMRSSDDGEPSGTAGRPILEVIKKEGLSNTAVVVTRYFGGILLGAGGLVRAYSKSAVLALEAAGKVIKLPAQSYTLSLGYEQWGKVQSYLASHHYQLDNVLYLEKITAFVTIEKTAEQHFLKELSELSAGIVEAVPVGGMVWLDKKFE